MRATCTSISVPDSLDRQLNVNAMADMKDLRCGDGVQISKMLKVKKKVVELTFSSLRTRSFV